MKNLKYLLSLFLILSFFIKLSFAQDMKKIVYSSNNSSNEFLQIFIMDEDGNNKIQLTEMSENCYAPKFSPDGRSVIFYTELEKIYYIADIDSAKNNPPKYIYPGISPTFAPSGDYIIFNAELDCPLSIFVIGLDEVEPVMVSTGSYSNQQVLSRDATKMVYSTFYKESKSIFMLDLMDTTSGALQKISINTDSNLEPDVSTNGDMVVYASFNSELKGTIYLFMDGKETQLTKGASWNTPVFSPDDTKIACVKISENESTELYIMNLDGSNKKELTLKGGNIGTFQWIDSENILYDAESSTQSTIGIININSGKVTVLTKEGINIHPDIQKDFINNDEEEEN